VLAAWCAHGDCPTVYETDRGTVVVQGYPVDPAAVGLSVPAGESLVEIPAELLARVTGAARSGPGEAASS
jgi:hypothetical protein